MVLSLCKFLHALSVYCLACGVNGAGKIPGNKDNGLLNAVLCAGGVQGREVYMLSSPWAQGEGKWFLLWYPIGVGHMNNLSPLACRCN